MTQGKSSVNVGIIGAGGVTRDLHLPALSNMHEVNIVWICDKAEERAQQLAKLFSIPQIHTDVRQCSDVDIVLIAIPVGYREDVMETIFHRGWHAFCEKPFASNLAQFDSYLEKAKEASVQVGIALVRRYSPATRMARRLIQSRYFGPITELWASEGVRTKRTGQEASFYMFDAKAAGGGVLMETGSHVIDQICTILDISEFRIDRCIQRKFEGLELETIFAGRISTDYQRSIRCSFQVSRLEDLCNGIFFRFSDFILKCGLGLDSSLQLCTTRGEVVSNLELTEVTESSAFCFEWRDFILQALSGKPSDVDARTARASMEIIEECYKTAEVLDVWESLSEKNNE